MNKVSEEMVDAFIHEFYGPESISGTCGPVIRQELANGIEAALQASQESVTIPIPGTSMMVGVAEDHIPDASTIPVEPQGEAGALQQDLDEAIQDCRDADNAEMEELLHRVDKALRAQPAVGAAIMPNDEKVEAVAKANHGPIDTSLTGEPQGEVSDEWRENLALEIAHSHTEKQFGPQVEHFGAMGAEFVEVEPQGEAGALEIEPDPQPANEGDGVFEETDFLLREDGRAIALINGKRRAERILSALRAQPAVGDEPQSEAGALAWRLHRIIDDNASTMTFSDRSFLLEAAKFLRAQPAVGDEPVAWMWEERTAGTFQEYTTLYSRSRPDFAVFRRNIRPLSPTGAAAEMREGCAKLVEYWNGETRDGDTNLIAQAIRNLPLTDGGESDG